MRGVARTAVVAGTATAVSNRVSRRQANRWANQEQQQYEQQYAQQAQYAPPPPPQQYYAPPAAEPAAAAEPDTVAQLQQLAGLKAQGILSEEEFAAAKAKVLGS
jgi:hypothetical protein